MIPFIFNLTNEDFKLESSYYLLVRKVLKKVWAGLWIIND